jgi:chitinase
MTLKVGFSRSLLLCLTMLWFAGELVAPVARGWRSSASVLDQPGVDFPQGDRAPVAAPSAHRSTRASRFEHQHLLIGYWQNFANEAAHLTLGQVPAQYDVINVAFGTPAPGTTSRITFEPEVESTAQFRSDVASLHRAGKKIVLSIGGADSPVVLANARDVNSFVSSLASIVAGFHFDGIDIDFEETSLQLDPGDSDFKHPTTPSVVNLIAALHSLNKRFGPRFIISYAPETEFVQDALTDYKGQIGCYLPVIYGTRTILTYVQTQDYNSGSIRGLDGNTYNGGTADFHVALTEMLLHGFNVAGDPSQAFPPLRSDQVVIGVPATPQGASASPPSYTAPADLRNALNCLIKGVPFDGQHYKLINSAGYPGIRGLMTWSINWDLSGGRTLSNELGPFLHSLDAR